MAFSAFAVTAPGLEDLAARELDGLGLAATARERGGVAFSATERELARCVVHARTITRVVVRMAEFRATSFAQLEHEAARVPWARFVARKGRASFRVTCRKSRLYHSDAVAERLQRALLKSVAGVSFDAPADDEDEGDDKAQLFVVRFANDVCTVSADACGASLYQRGYRQAIAKAPLRETLAAAMLMGAGYTGGAVYDPMCGSGTIVIEAAMFARKMAPGLQRAFRAERWPIAHANVWQAVRSAARAEVLARADVPFMGSDRDAGAIDAARANAERAGVSADVEFTVAAIASVTAPADSGLLITNPPYGIRASAGTDIRDLYATFGRVAREQFAHWKCAVLSADRSAGHDLERQIGLTLHESWRSTNGGIPVRLLAGTARPKTRSRTRD